MQILAIFKNAVMISFFVFVMMLLVDFIDVASERYLSRFLKGGQWRQYTLASFLGSTPGCLGAFMNVSLYVHGLISFGAIVGGMIATSGDEAFVMLTQFPDTALLLFILLFVSGILFAWIADKLVNILGISICESCLKVECEHCSSDGEKKESLYQFFKRSNLIDNFRSLSFTRSLLLFLIVSFMILVALGFMGPSSWDWKRITFMGLSLTSLLIALVAPEHYLNSHIWDHIIKNHILRVFLWTFGVLLFLHWGLSFWHLDTLIQQHMVWILLSGALLGIIPESGPHLIFVMLYAKGMVPFSVLFTTSFVQDGHGMLPMLAHSKRAFLGIKVFNLTFGLCVGGTLFAMGL